MEADEKERRRIAREPPAVVEETKEEGEGEEGEGGEGEEE